MWTRISPECVVAGLPPPHGSVVTYFTEHVDDQLAYVICECPIFPLYLTDVEAEALQTATGGDLVWESITGARQR